MPEMSTRSLFRNVWRKKRLRVQFEASRLEGAGFEQLEGVQQPQNLSFPYQTAYSIPNKLRPPLAYASASLVMQSIPSRAVSEPGKPGEPGKP